MASITMTASFLSNTNLTKGSPRIAQRRRLVVANAAAKGADVESVKLSDETKRGCNNGRRRELMFAAAAAAVCSVAGVASAEPKPGTPEAKKVYAPVCVTMPTSKICHK